MKDKYRICSPNGIDEKIFVRINGQDQYVRIRGNDTSNPVILNLHGGPASPDTIFTYEFAQCIRDDFTYVCWDQRGCGRTYYKNKKIDFKNKTADFQQALKDVDAIVHYLCNRFQKDKLIILGHSYGSLLGIYYISAYPQKVEKYIGVGQSVSIINTQRINYNELLVLCSSDQKKVDQLSKAYQRMQEHFSLESLMNFQRLALPCFVENITDAKNSRLQFLLSSPELAFDDIRWLLQMLGTKGHYAKNKQLLDFTLTANTYDAGLTFSVPMLFISGEHDKHCRVELLREYYDAITAPSKELVVLNKCGHSPQIDAPELFAAEIKQSLQA